MLDAFTPPHEEGSHHGDTRIIRFAYGEGASYVPFVKRAGELWYELESLVNESLFLQNRCGQYWRTNMCLYSKCEG